MDNMKILVVDDELDVKDLFMQRFRREIRSGLIDFNFAHSGEAALSFLNDQILDSILILSDINMPGMSGLELLRQTREKFTTPPPYIMMITAYGDKQTYETAMQLGADGFLNKPIDFESLKEKLNNLA
jgi:two-component system, chemotaxis family, chemotaxis protein CheY